MIIRLSLDLALWKICDDDMALYIRGSQVKRNHE